jgi:hypothetical protein
MLTMVVLDKVKKITLKIDDDVLGRMRSDISIKMMSGNFAGTIDAFIKKLIDQIDGGNKEWHCQYKNKNDQ